MRVSIFSHQADPTKDQPFLRKSRAYAKELLTQAKAFILDGKSEDETQAIQLFAPIDRSTPKLEIEHALGWHPSFGRMRSTVLNEGGAGQNVARYPIPYVYKGHITRPWAKDVNFVPKHA